MDDHPMVSAIPPSLRLGSLDTVIGFSFGRSRRFVMVLGSRAPAGTGFDLEPPVFQRLNRLTSTRDKGVATACGLSLVAARERPRNERGSGSDRRARIGGDPALLR